MVNNSFTYINLYVAAKGGEKGNTIVSLCFFYTFINSLFLEQFKKEKGKEDGQTVIKRKKKEVHKTCVRFIKLYLIKQKKGKNTRAVI